MIGLVLMLGFSSCSLLIGLVFVVKKSWPILWFWPMLHVVHALNFFNNLVSLMSLSLVSYLCKYTAVCVCMSELNYCVAIVSLCRLLGCCREDLLETKITAVVPFCLWSQDFLMLTYGFSPLAYIIAFCVSYVCES